jgi:3-dehydroquinate synthase
MMHRSVSVKLTRKAESYDINIGSGFLSGDVSWPSGHLQEMTGKVAIVSNKTVFDIYGVSLLKRLAHLRVEPCVHLIGDGERYKNFKTLEQTLGFLSENKIGRTDTVLALGGGVVGDLAGFAASIHLRGISFIQMPTTLLSMIDSSVGGKTGINTSFGKNLVGSFYQPKEVLIDTDVLATLPRRELTSGLCEAIKQGVLGGTRLFSQTVDLVEKLATEAGTGNLNASRKLSATSHQPGLSDILAAQVSFKAKIVAGDERESVFNKDSKSRKILNFGHTFAHALEKVTNYRYLKHGEAVGYGILFAAELSKKLELLDNNAVNLLNDVVHRTGKLPPIGHIAPGDVFDAFRFDKKLVGNDLHWILLNGIGKPVIVPQTEIPRRIIRTLTENFIRTT